MAILWFIPTNRRFQLIFMSFFFLYLKSEYAPSTPIVIAMIVHITILIGVIIPIRNTRNANTIEITPVALNFLYQQYPELPSEANLL
jgi:hypothetical protein